MLEFIHTLANIIQQHPELGLLSAFLIAFAESLPLIGTLIPGSITMTAIGALVGSGILPGLETLTLASVGALCGDIIGFWLGYLYTDKIPTIWPFRKHPKWLEMSKAFFEKHGGKSILIGRFIGPARSTVPLVAGLLKMSWTRFILAATPSALLWAILYLVPGIILGALAVELPPKLATMFVFVGLLVIVGMWLIFWALQYFFQRLLLFFNHQIDRAWDWLSQHRLSNPLIRFITNQKHPEDHHQLTLSLLGLVASALFISLFIAVMHSASITSLNAPLFYLAQSLRSEKLTAFFTVITLFSNPESLLVVSALTSTALALLKQWRSAIHLCLLSCLAAGATLACRILFYSQRPLGFHFVKTSSSFPSGHTVMSTVVLTALAYYTKKLLPRKFRWIPYTISSTLIMLSALSRLYLGAHWLTDILGGWMLGMALLCILNVSYRRYSGTHFQDHTKKRIWFSVLALSLLVPWSYQLSTQYRKAIEQYTPNSTHVQVSIHNWWRHPLKHLPFFQDSRFGKALLPFNVQFAGNLQQLETRLSHQGWKTVNPLFTVKSTLRHFINYQSKYALPVLTTTYQHHPASLMMTKTIDNDNLVMIRLWQANVSFTDSTLPLWIGTINYQSKPDNLIPASYMKFASFEDSSGLYFLVQSLGPLYQKKTETINKTNLNLLQKLHWDGVILIIRD